MSNKMIKCNVCGNEIAENAKTCPQCGANNKKPIYKKWWFWVLIVVLVLMFLGSDGESESSTDNNNKPNTEIDSETNSNDSHDQESVNTESSEENNKLSKVEMYKWIAENATATFEIQEQSITFIKEHETFFPGSEDNKGAMSDYVNWEVGYPHLSKSINKHTGELFATGGHVIDIDEAEDGSVTYFHITGYDGYNYTFYYLGVLDDVFEGTEVYVYALPLDMVTFENMGGAYTEAVVGAVCYVQTGLYD